MNTLPTSASDGNTIADNVSASAPFAVDFLDPAQPRPRRDATPADTVALTFRPIHATIGLPVGRVGNLAAVDVADVLPGQFVRVSFNDRGADRSIVGIFQFVADGVVRVVVSMPDAVFRRVRLADITRVELLVSLQPVRGEA
ncbi:MAG: hypothetical protein AAF663_00450 [Planctomycetota bacterium]